MPSSSGEQCKLSRPEKDRPGALLSKASDVSWAGGKEDDQAEVSGNVTGSNHGAGNIKEQANTEDMQII